jgi:hypothetical protein
MFTHMPAEGRVCQVRVYCAVAYRVVLVTGVTTPMPGGTFAL